MRTRKKYIEPDLDEDASPLCPHCFGPLAPYDKACPRCGSRIGMDVPYASYAYASGPSDIWKKSWEILWRPDTSVIGRLYRLIILFFSLPIMLLSLFVTLLSLIPIAWNKWRGRAK